MNIRKSSLPFILIISVLIFYLEFGNLRNSFTPQQYVKDVPNSENVHRSSQDDIDLNKNGINKTINVLLLAYARSGSSFTGELLSNGDVFYVYEPSFEYSLGRKITDTQNITEILNGIYNCNEESLEMLSTNHLGVEGTSFFYPKESEGNIRENATDLIDSCKSSRIHIIKTIRLSMETAQQLIFTYPSLNLKIIHLVRDPRAMVHSLKQMSFWGKSTIEKVSNCEQLRNDLKFSKNIPDVNYIRVRYEDLATKTLETIVRVYQNVGLPLIDNLAYYISDHMRSKKIPKNDKRETYFSTFKNKRFNPNKWMRSLNLSEIKEIETHCEDVIKDLNYAFYKRL